MSFSRLVLIVPPQSCVLDGFRTALVALSSYVRRKLPAIKVDIVDLSVVHRSELVKELRQVLAGADRVVAGISTLTADYQAALDVAKAIKTLDPAIITLLGGHHASADAKVILRSHPRLVDFIVVGEGEAPLVEFIRSYPNLDQIPGLAYREAGAVVVNAAPPLLATEDLDCIPAIYSDIASCSQPGKFEHATYVSARGCPLKCSFCAVSNQQIRHKSVSRIIEDIRALARLGHTRIAFEDNFFANSRTRTRDLCRALIALRNEGVEFSWDCQTRVESMDHPETVTLMQNAGCDAVYLGVEGLHDDVLRFLGKTRNPSRYLSSLENNVVPTLLDSEIDIHINLQFGLPGLSSADVTEATVARITKLGRLAAARGKKITVFPQLFVIYPGTAHFHLYRRTELLPEDVFETFTEWEAEQHPVLSWLGETFAHGTGGIPIGIMNQHGLWRREYQIDAEAVESVSNLIDRVADLKGVAVFRYGQFLVKDKKHAGHSSPLVAPDPARSHVHLVADRGHRSCNSH